MYLRPTYFIARFIMRNLILRLKLNSVFIKMFQALFTTIPTLIITVGMIPTVKVLIYLQRYISAGHSLPVIRVLFNNGRFNPQVVTSIINAILPYWDICVKSHSIFRTLFNLYLVLTVVGLSRTILYYIIRNIIIVLLGSLGICFSEFLSAIQYLKIGSDYILDTANGVFKFKIPKNVVDNVLDRVDIENNIDNIADSPNNNYIISILGLIVLGTVGIIVVVCISDYYAPEITREIPFVGNIVDAVHNTWNTTVESVQSTWNSCLNSVHQFIYGSNSNPPGTPPNNPNIPESISRSSSTDSDVTIRDIRTITPPITPEPQITPPQTPEPSTSYDPSFILSSRIPAPTEYTDPFSNGN